MSLFSHGPVHTIASLVLVLAVDVGHSTAQSAATHITPQAQQTTERPTGGEGGTHLDRARGQSLYDANQLPEAERAFADAMQQDPRDDEAIQMRGLTLFRMGRPADAIPLLEQARGQGVQRKADPSYVLALCYIDTRRYDDARRAFAAQYGFAPDSAAAYLLAGRMLLRREYLPVAERFAQQAVALDPHLPLAHELLGEIQLAGNRLDDAAASFRLEIQIDPADAASYERLGDLLGRQGKFSESRITLQRAVLLEPNATGPYILLGRTTLREGDAAAALTYLQRAEHMDPANAMTHSLLAQAYRTLNRPADATRELGTVEKLHAVDAPRLIPVQ